MIIGWLGLILLISSYIFLLFDNMKGFLLIDSIASLLLTIHAIILNDWPFILVNGFITFVLSYKYYQEVKK